MTKKYLIFLFVFLFISIKVSAQKDPQFTLFPWGYSFYNPAAMGEMDKHLNFTGIMRQQSIRMRVEKEGTGSVNEKGKQAYDKIKGEQIFLGIDSYIKKIKGAVGISFLKDKNAEFDNVGFKFGYAGKIPFRGGKFGIGLQFGFLNMKPITDKYKPLQDNDPTLTGLKEVENYLDFDLNLGLHYKAPTWHIGVSATQLLGGVRVSGGDNYLDIPRQMYFSGGYIWNLKTPTPWSIEPNLLIHTDFATWSIDIMALARYNGILWFGASYQLDNAVSVLFGAVPFYNSTNNYLKGLEVGLAYGFPITKYGFQANGSFGDFELLVRYGFNFFKDKITTGYGSSRHLYKNQF